MGTSHPRILTLTRHYLPGNKAGGPVRTVSNMVDWLGDELDFYIFTSDRDLGDDRPYPNIVRGDWQPVGNAQVCYLSPQAMSIFGLFTHIRKIDHDVVYINGIFGSMSRSYLVLRRLRLVPSNPLVLAPRGEFDPGALSLKSRKKQFYLKVARFLNLYQGILWQASSVHEQANIHALFPGADVHIACNLGPRQYHFTEHRLQKIPKQLKILYLARVTPKKQLDLAIELLEKLGEPVQFDIFGNIEDIKYWNECQTLIDNLPPQVNVNYCGNISHENAVAIMSQYHLFFMPTLGENFGHSILEALNAGNLILISDQTPWRNLTQRGIGWDLPLTEPERFLEALKEMVDMDDDTFQTRAAAARAFGRECLQRPTDRTANYRLFERALEFSS